VLIRSELTLASARRLQVTDLVLGIAAGALLVVGLLRVFFFEKGAEYYFHSHAFLAKFSLFIVIGLLSIIPDHGIPVVGRGDQAGQVPAVEPKKLRAGHDGGSTASLLRSSLSCSARRSWRGVGGFSRHSGARGSANPESRGWFAGLTTSGFRVRATARPGMTRKKKEKREMPSAYFVVRATVTDPARRAAFDVWYSREHLPDAAKGVRAPGKRAVLER